MPVAEGLAQREGLLIPALALVQPVAPAGQYPQRGQTQHLAVRILDRAMTREGLLEGFLSRGVVLHLEMHPADSP